MSNLINEPARFALNLKRNHSRTRKRLSTLFFLCGIFVYIPVKAQKFDVKINDKAVNINSIVPVKDDDMIQITITHPPNGYNKVISKMDLVPCYNRSQGDQRSESSRNHVQSFESWFALTSPNSHMLRHDINSTVIMMSAGVLSNCPNEIFYVNFYIAPTYQSQVKYCINGKLKLKFILRGV